MGENSRSQSGYLAGNDEERLHDLVQMAADPEIQAIFLSRGGYGLTRLLDRIDYDLFAANPKTIMGYSDFTALSLVLLKKARLLTFSGPMVASELGNSFHPGTETWMWKVLMSRDKLVLTPEELGFSSGIIRPGRASGPLLCGTLSIICSMLGTDYAPDFDGAILMLEDIGEEPYRIDRYFSQLKLAHVFDKIAGLVLGQFTHCTPAEGVPSFTVDEVIRDYTGDLPVAVMANFPYGHNAVKYTLPVGAMCHLDCEKAQLIIDFPGESYV